MTLFSLIRIAVLTSVLLFAASPMLSVASAATEGHSAAEHSAAEHSAETQPSTDPFTFDSFKRDLALWNLIIFGIVFVIMAKYAFGPIAKALDAREQSVADNIASAEKANVDAKAVLAEYHQKLAASESEVRSIIDSGKKEAEKISASIVEKARDAARQESEKALKEMEAATKLALQELAQKSAFLATDLAGKIIRERIDPKAHNKLIESAIGQFASVN